MKHINFQLSPIATEGHAILLNVLHILPQMITRQNRGRAPVDAVGRRHRADLDLAVLPEPIVWSDGIAAVERMRSI